MGAGGSAMATEAADIVMMSDNIVRIPETLAICRMGRAIIIQNCALAISIKIIAVVFAVLGYLQFWQAVLIDIGTLLLVVANGTRPLGLDTYERSMSMFRNDLSSVNPVSSNSNTNVVVELGSQDEGDDEGMQLQSLHSEFGKVTSITSVVIGRPRSLSGEGSVLLPLRDNEKPTP
jgi:hypothetical protein